MGPPHPQALSARQPRLSCSSSSGTTRSGSSENRRAISRKENQFIYRNGSKLHAYDRDKVPYPISYDRDVMELECVDYAMIQHVMPKMSWNANVLTSKRCLDLGTGLGMWVISAAKSWTDATFVGLDMTNIQIPRQLLDPEIADRVEWVHCNILRNKLPFDDDEFDHVHIQKIALGIPENKWYPLYEEIRRVMKPGATIEHIEEDAIFPALPRWYTDTLRTHSRLSTDSAQHRLSIPHIPDTSHLTHEHELLETLYAEVWSNRFINPTPTSSVPGYFGAFFEHVVSPPVLQLPMPPFVAPLPDPEIAPPPPPNVPPHTNDNGASDVHINGHTTDLPRTEAYDNYLTPSPSPPLQNFAVNGGMSSLSATSLMQEDRIPQPMSRKDSAAESTTSFSSAGGSSNSGKRPSVIMLASPSEGTTLGSAAADIFPLDRMNEDYEQTTLYMHLHLAVKNVLATKEAMWEELAARVLKRDEALKRYGWRDEEYDEQTSRVRFDVALERYQSDMHTRLSLWNCAVQTGWAIPPRDAPSKAEVTAEMHLRREILEAQRLSADSEEMGPPSRMLRILTGSKES